MSLRIPEFSINYTAKWGSAIAITIGAVVSAKKVYTAFSRSVQTSVNKPKNIIEVKSEDSNEKLLEIVNRYLEFINRISKGEVFSYGDSAASILTDNCKKILNGKLFTKTRDDFISDLLQVNRTQGCWDVTPVDIISSPQNKCVTLRLMIDMKNLGAFTAIVILRFNSDYLISEINEVFNKVEDSYHFDDSNKGSNDN